MKHNLHLLVLPLLPLLFAGCALTQPSLPQLRVIQHADHLGECARVYPTGDWQFVHTIDFSTGDGRTTTVMGVTTLSAKTLHSALVTVEGLTLFEADFFPDKSFLVHRAVPPFDNPHFARGMMRDIRTIFLAPDTTSQSGETASEDLLCRYTDDDGPIIDVVPGKNGDKDDCWQIMRYTPQRSRDLLVTGSSCREYGTSLIPQRLHLQSSGLKGYTLNMKLLSADRL